MAKNRGFDWVIPTVGGGVTGLILGAHHGVTIGSIVLVGAMVGVSIGLAKRALFGKPEAR